MNLRNIKNAKNVLVFAVGGGNDSVSTLLLQKQLQIDFNYNPELIDVVAMLPDCLDYGNMTSITSLLSIIRPDSTRSVQGKLMNGFPEVVLSTHKRNILPIDTVYGISMFQGSVGVKIAIETLLALKQYDLIFAIDVGGDFIAVEENIEVLSPMMDGYMLHALTNIKTDIPIIYGVFGLGTDGESTPEMLDAALARIPNSFSGKFAKSQVQDFIDFYRNIVEPNRYSRTTDFTIKEITGEGHPNPAEYRGRFHVKYFHNQPSAIYYGTYLHKQSEKYYGKYFLFDDVSKVKNIFSEPCNNGIEWYLRVQKQDTKINHELNGQSYNLFKYLGNDFVDAVLFFGTPSRKFHDDQQREIVNRINCAILNGIYDFSIIYKKYSDELIDVYTKDINDDLSLVGIDDNRFDKLYDYLISL